MEKINEESKKNKGIKSLLKILTNEIVHKSSKNDYQGHPLSYYYLKVKLV